MKTIFWNVFFFICFTIVSTDEETVFLWKPEQYPTTIKNSKFCTGSFRNPPTSICDPEMVLTVEQAQNLDHLIDNPPNGTACFCEPCGKDNPVGLIIKVAIVKSIDIAEGDTFEKACDSFAEKIRLKWNLSKLCQNDLLIFYSSTYSYVTFSLGTRAEKIIKKKHLRKYIDRTNKQFINNMPYEGLDTIITLLQDDIKNYDPTVNTIFSIFHDSYLTWIIVGLLLLIIIAALLGYYIKRENKIKTSRSNYSLASKRTSISSNVYSDRINHRINRSLKSSSISVNDENTKNNLNDNSNENTSLTISNPGSEDIPPNYQQQQQH